uniref:uncharacterized protein LOC122583377 n=1 Tax=Erigeron canadensis TaxID=72917 RepID=UPI001CB8F5E6|nr:uncharacterized protein LOC122583377 [Erigeron canadensis]
MTYSNTACGVFEGLVKKVTLFEENQNQEVIKIKMPDTTPIIQATQITQETLPDVESVHHPLYLHQTDHPGLILIAKKLTGSENFSSWKRSMLIALSAKNKIKIVTGEYKEPEATSPPKPLWERTNDMKHYAQLDGHRIYQITADVSQLKQENTNIEVYYHKLKGLWDELDALEAPYACTCKCSCENGKINGEREQRKREGHTKDECYQIVGYPPGHPLHGKFKNPTTPFKGKTVNSIISHPNLTSPVPYTGMDSPVNVNSASADNAMHSRMDQLQNQLNQLMLMMQHTTQASCIKDFIDAWILDNGATDHICITLALFTHITTCPTPITVNLPNGQQVLVTQIGTVKLQSDLILHNVFYIPTLAYNLISVRKLAKSTNSSIIFTDEHCYLHAHKRLIPLGSILHGLYIYIPPSKSNSTILSTQSSSSSNLWHSKLGHPSHQVL